MKIGLIAFTSNGGKTAQFIKSELENKNHLVNGFLFHKYERDGFMPFTDAPVVIKDFFVCGYDAVLFVGAAGIAVRTIAGFIDNKATDPAVIVIDEKSTFVIPILSGHLGGANELAVKLAQILLATPVITTATDVNKKLAIDVWAKENQLFIKDMKLVREVSARILNGDPVGYYCDYIPAIEMPEGLSITEKNFGVCVTTSVTVRPFSTALYLIPGCHVLGIGCKKGMEKDRIEKFVMEQLMSNDISIDSVIRICSINLKKDEPGIVDFAKQLGVEFKTYSANELNEIEGTFEESEFVKQMTGVGSVCERSAAAGSNMGKKVVGKRKEDGITLSVYKWRKL